MARIDAALFARLEQKLKLSRPRIYQLIEQKARATHLPSNLAAIALATERGINVSKYATTDDLAAIRQAAIQTVPPPVVLPTNVSRVVRTTRKQTVSNKSPKAEPRRGNTVFVVHGRNLKLRDAMFAFLRALSLKPLEWNQIIKLTAEPSPYVGTILERAFHDAAAIVVLLTPDDEARLSKPLHGDREPSVEKTLMGQARPNVLFEAGMAFGRDANSTVLVQIGDVKPFSDVAGRHIVRMSNNATSRQELVTRLANAGCNVDTTGTDWLSAGDFDFRARVGKRRKK
jgi:predicted nucleotide-binding protein